MIAKKFRFSGQNGIRFVYRKGQTYRSKYFAAKFLTDPKKSTYTASVVISKKVAKSAPLRNRVRRRIYEQIRLQAPLYLKNEQVVFTIFDSALAVISAKELEDHIKRALVFINQTTKQQHR